MHILIPLFALLTTLSAHALDLARGGDSLWSDLNADQQKALVAGQQIAVTQKVTGSEWANHMAYQWVEATPEEAAAVFADYDAQRTYIPKIVESRISQIVAPDHVFVDYKIDVGFMGIKSTYTVENRARHISERSEYWLKWDFVKASHATAIDGLVRVQPLGKGAIFFYQLYTEIPSGILTGIVKDQGLESLKTSVRAIVAQIKKEKKEQPELLARQVKNLSEALAKP